VIERVTRAGQDPEFWTRPENIVSNGPYVLKQAQFRQFVLLEKNPRYWDTEHVKLARIRLAMIESANTVLNMYEAGELDSIGSSALPAEFLDLLRQKRDFHSAPYLGIYYYWLNTQAPPLDDVRVREALRLAIDRQSIVDNITRGGQIPTSDMVPKGLAGYPGLNSPLFDPERARALLREAGYGPEHPLPKFTLRYNTSEGHKQAAEAVQAMWRKHLGATVELENQEWKVFLKSIAAHDFQIARAGWLGDYPDPLTFLDLLASYNGNNHANWRDPHYDALLEHANHQRYPAARMQLLQEAERYLMRAVPVIPLYVYTRSELVKPYLRGHALNYEGRQQFKYWWIDAR
jgi:oligopeptide transport system substrate-binding protein